MRVLVLLFYVYKWAEMDDLLGQELKFKRQLEWFKQTSYLFDTNTANGTSACTATLHQRKDRHKSRNTSSEFFASICEKEDRVLSKHRMIDMIVFIEILKGLSNLLIQYNQYNQCL